MTTYKSIRKITTVQRNDYTTGCLLDYPYFEEHNTIRAIDLSKRQELDTDPKAIQHTNFTGNLNQAGNTTIQQLKKQKKLLWLSHKVLSEYCKLISVYYNISIK